MRNPHRDVLALARHKAGSERERTTTPFPPELTEVEAWHVHDRLTLDFTQALREGRCRRTRRFHEGLAETVSVLAPLVGPWNLELLFLLSMRGALRFNALKEALGGVSSRVLTDKLRHLERHGLVERQAGEGAQAYALTPRGDVVARHLHPIVFYLRNLA